MKDISLKNKIKQFVQAHKAVNKYYEGPYQRLRGEKAQSKGLQKMLGALDHMELMKEDILKTIEKEMEKLEMVRRIMEAWKQGESEYINLSTFTMYDGKTMLTYSLYSSREYEKKVILD